MYDDGMRRMSTSCEDGHDESDAALDRRPISLQVGLRDLQRRPPSVPDPCPNGNGTTTMTVTIWKMVVEGQRV